MRTAFLFPLLLCLGACSAESQEGGFLDRVDAPIAAPLIPPLAAANGAILTLPNGAGPPGQVRERIYPNGARQVVPIGGPAGEPTLNDIEITLAKRGARRRAGWVSVGKPSAEGVRSEILSRFPGMRMEIVTRPLFNSLGRFGLAIGRSSSGLRCVFAWQWVGDLRDADPDRSTVKKAMDSLTGRGLPASIRVRLCRPDMTLDQLADFLQGLSLTSPQDLRRLLAEIGSQEIDGGGPIAVEGAGASGLAPLSQSLEAALGPAPPPRTIIVARKAPIRRAPPARARKPARPAAAVQTIEPVHPVALSPKPSKSDDHGDASGPNGERYLASPGESARSGAQAPVLGRAGRSVAAGPSLPPQAYKGPGQGADSLGADGPHGGAAPTGAAP